MAKKRVLFVCLGNICRSPMAEALARTYGSDVLQVASAGLTPAVQTTFETRAVLAEKNIELGDHIPRDIRSIDEKAVDLIINMSGRKLHTETPVEDWNVKDPYGQKLEAFRIARDDIEMRVMRLILRVRAGKS